MNDRGLVLEKQGTRPGAGELLLGVALSHSNHIPSGPGLSSFVAQ